MTDEHGTWYILEADMIHGMFYRAKYEQVEPDMLMLELAAMCNTVDVEADDDD